MYCTFLSLLHSYNMVKLYYGFLLFTTVDIWLIEEMCSMLEGKYQ